jgi:hypothetical protein
VVEKSPEASRALAQRAVDSLRSSLGGNAATVPAAHFDSHLADSLEDIGDQMKSVGRRLRQNELLLRVAVFETFMRDVHRAVLREAPTLLRADRDVKLGRLLSQGVDAIVTDEIDREVAAVERKGVAETSQYFRERLKIDWSFDGTVLPLLEAVTDARNTILHEDPDADISDRFLGRSLTILIAIPWLTLLQAALLYPKSFALPERVSREEAKNILRESESPLPAATVDDG